MTTSPIWTVFCDAKWTGCHHWCDLTDATAPLARKNARSAGWHKVDQRDICPNCWKAGAR